MSNPREHLIRNKYREVDDVMVHGDETDASLYANILAEAGQGVGKLIAEKKAAEAAKAKSDADKAAYDKAHVDEKAAVEEMAATQKRAAMSAIDAGKAKAQADAVEADPNGPQHKAAQKVAQKAALDQAAADASTAKVAFYQGASGALAKGYKGGKSPLGVPWYEQIPKPVLYIGGGLVGVGLLALIIKAVRK